MDLSKLITGVTIESEWGPAITIPDPFKPAPPNPALQIIKPKVTLQIAGVGPVTMAPYGNPGPSKWPMVKMVALALAGGAALYLIKRRRR